MQDQGAARLFEKLFARKDSLSEGNEPLSPAKTVFAKLHFFNKEFLPSLRADLFALISGPAGRPYRYALADVASSLFPQKASVYYLGPVPPVETLSWVIGVVSKDDWKLASNALALRFASSVLRVEALVASKIAQTRGKAAALPFAADARATDCGATAHLLRERLHGLYPKSRGAFLKTFG